MAPAVTGPPTPVPELSAGLHFPCLDTYRALGMTMVLLIHAAFATGYDKTSWLGPYLARFDLALPMFFIISGFLLYLPYVKELLRDRRVDTRDYYRRRGLRIFPGYWAALVGITVIFSLQVDGVRQFVANVFFLPAFGSTEGYLIFPAWSIGIELTFYLVLPLYALGLRRILSRRPVGRRVRGMLTGALVLYVLGEAIRFAIVIADPSWAGRSLLWFPLYLEFFAIGMGVAIFVVTSPTTDDLPRPLAWMARHPGACWTSALVVFLAVAQLTPPETPFGLSGREYLPRQFGYGLISVLWLLPAFFGDQSAGRIRGFLQLRPLAYLGGISYSFYLWHLVLVDQAKQWTVSDLDQRELIGGLAPFTGNFWLISLIAWVCTAIVASILFRFVELPFLKLKDRPLRDLWKRTPGRRMIRHG